MFRTVANLKSLGDIFLTGDAGSTRYTLKEVILSFIFITIPIIIIFTGLIIFFILKSEGVR